MICGTCATQGLRTIAELHEHRATSCKRAEWAQVVDLRAKGQDDAADRAARRAMGIKGEPMSEETKEKLRLWKLAHAQEIRDRRELEAMTRARVRAITKPAAGPLRRKV